MGRSSNVESKAAAVESSRVSNMLHRQSRATNTNSLESIDSNPRQAVAKSCEKRGNVDPQVNPIMGSQSVFEFFLHPSFMLPAAMRLMRAGINGPGHPRRPPYRCPTPPMQPELSSGGGPLGGKTPVEGAVWGGQGRAFQPSSDAWQPAT